MEHRFSIDYDAMDAENELPVKDDAKDSCFQDSMGESKLRTNALEDTDTRKDKVSKRLVEALRKLGPYSKNIAN